MRRAGVVLLSIAVVVAIGGCAGADHSWSGEFDARLEGAAATVEEARKELKPQMSADEYPTIFCEQHLPTILESEVAKLERLEREAKTCATG